MALLTESQILDRAGFARANWAGTESRQVTARAVLEEHRRKDKIFDVFLSHSSNEPDEILLGIVDYLEDQHLSVYVDKYTDPDLSPDAVSRETAAILRSRLRASKSLLYVHSRHSNLSRWMPWELGFMDGLERKIGIIPVREKAEQGFEGEEYLSLYPYVDRATIENTSKHQLWINNSRHYYARLDLWIKENQKITKHES
jgi:hypothetical protein